MTALPPSTDFTGAAITEAQFKTAISNLRAYLAGLFGSDGTAATAIATLGASPFPSGTLMLFVQTAAPTGWTKSTTHNDKALRVVSGSVSSGGSVAFSTAFGRTATDGHSLTSAENGPHSHSLSSDNGGNGYKSISGDGNYGAYTTGSSGSGTAHSHNIDLRVNYVDVIIATKD